MTTLTHPIAELDRKGLREFGLITGAIFAGLFGLFFPWLLETASPLWPWALGGALVVGALVFPDSLKPVYYWWMRFALLLSRITTPMILGLVFFVVILPVALVMKVVRRDAMARNVKSPVATYRIPSKEAPREQMERPF